MLKHLLLALTFALPATAQTALECDDWKSHAQNVVEPWDTYSRTFAEGEVRLALMDMIEPAAAAFYLLVLSPPYDEVGGRSCAMVAEGDGEHGFHELGFDKMTASYDPALGLTLHIPAKRYDPDYGDFAPAMLQVTINQATGDVAANYEDH